SDDIGNIINYLEVGALNTGEISDVFPVRLVNMTGMIVRQFGLYTNRLTLPNGVNVEISRTAEPFVPESSIVYFRTLEDGQYVTFYVRIVTTSESSSGSGEFEVHVDGVQ